MKPGPQGQRQRAGYSVVMDSPLGRLGIRLQHDAVCAIDFLPHAVPVQVAGTAIACRVVSELERYFEASRHPFGVAVALAGTPFQLRVWQALRAIPAGEFRSYGQLAAQLGSGARALGNACRHNPVPIIVPCHRVVAATGLGGYGGRTGGRQLQRKRWLLEHEGVAAGALKNQRAAPMTREHHAFARSSQA
jgi:methylated-DNA-[protein]-cysteine S-methyltransferase